MSIKTYNKYQNQKLSENFDTYEFRCKCGGLCSETKIDDKLVDYLQQIRTHFGKPITITSGYRCERHNANVGGSSGSKHKTGQATDIVVEGVSPAEVCKYAESIGVKGIGIYDNFTHIDTRDYKGFWKGHQQDYVKTFGGVVSEKSNEGTNTNSTNFDGTTTNKNNAPQLQTLCFGKKNSDVVYLQQVLMSMGYDLGVYGADGHFGTKTYVAVCQFQRDNGLDVDGIVGNNTWNKILELVD